MKKTVAVAVIFFLVVLAAVLLTVRRSQFPTAWLQLPDGTSARILAVTYGTNHVLGPPMVHFAASLHGEARAAIMQFYRGRQDIQIRTTQQPTLIVWLDRRKDPGAPAAPTGNNYIQAVLGDGSNFVSGLNHPIMSWIAMSQAEAVQYDVFPRRQRDITMNFFYHQQTNFQQSVTKCGTLCFPNPLYRSYPQWKPETLPATKSAGDLEITVDRVETGYNYHAVATSTGIGAVATNHDVSRLTGDNWTSVDAKIHSRSGSNETWSIVSAEASDATGNHAHSMSTSWIGAARPFAFLPALWSDEQAWKLRLELKQTGALSSNLLVTF